MGRIGIFWFLLAVTLLVYGLLVGWAGQDMIALTNGAAIPDLRVTGYGVDDIRALLEGAEPGFPEAYARISRTWDVAVPVLFGVTFAYGIWLGGGAWRWLALVQVVMGLSDLTENALVTQSLLAGPDALDPGTIGRASAATMLKWLLLPVSILLLVATFFKTRARASKG